MPQAKGCERARGADRKPISCQSFLKLSLLLRPAHQGIDRFAPQWIVVLDDQLLQEYLPHDPDQGIVRLEFLGGDLLYAMRVKTHGRFNLCPSPVCNPDEGEGLCETPAHPETAAAPVEFYPFPEVPRQAVDTAARIVRAARLDVGGIEYLETPDGRRVFYDINANSNLRPSVAAAWGFDPFERVVDYLETQLRDAAVLPVSLSPLEPLSP